MRRRYSRVRDEMTTDAIVDEVEGALSGKGHLSRDLEVRDRMRGGRGGELQEQHRRRLRGVRSEGQAGLGSQGEWGAGRALEGFSAGNAKISLIKSEAVSCSCRWRIKYVAVGVGGGEPEQAGQVEARTGVQR